MNAIDLLFDLDSYYSSVIPTDVWVFIGLLGVDNESHLLLVDI